MNFIWIESARAIKYSDVKSALKDNSELWIESILDITLLQVARLLVYDYEEWNFYFEMWAKAMFQDLISCLDFFANYVWSFKWNLNTQEVGQAYLNGK